VKATISNARGRAIRGEATGRRRCPRAGSGDFVGIGRSTAWLWRQNDPEFATAWDEAVAEGVDRLEDEAHRRAVEGYNPRPVYHKGKKVGEIREYSDSLLALLLKSRRPEVYARGDKAPTPDVSLNMTLQEHFKQLERLGLPVPVLKGIMKKKIRPIIREVVNS
jgi:hypothetical protein